MKKKSLFSILGFSLFVVPVLLTSYQNCSEYQSKNVLQNSISKSSLHSPIYLENLAYLGYSPRLCSESNNITEAVLYSKTSHLCALAKTTCEADFLNSQGFTPNQDSDSCSNSVHIDTIQPQKDFMLVKATDLGFDPAKHGDVCTLQVESLVNIKHRRCSIALNGCQSSFLKTIEFDTDLLGICSNMKP